MVLLNYCRYTYACTCTHDYKYAFRFLITLSPQPYVSTQFSTTPDTKGKSDSKAKGSSTTAKSTERVEAKGSSIAVQERQSTTGKFTDAV